MKSAAAIAAALCLVQPVLAGADDYVSFVRQHQQGTGVYWDMQGVAAKGSSAAVTALDEKGALFQLWTVQKTGGRDYLLDQKTVGAYMPKAVVQVVTLDPYDKIARTRADQPFTVNITMSDLLSGSNLPQAASSVLVEHHLAPYPTGQTSIPLLTAIAGAPYGSGYITKNGVSSFNFQRSAIVQPVTKKPFGEEHFTVHALSDGTIAQTKIAGGYVQVWPVATGSIQGIQPKQVIRFDAPRLTLVLQDLYPGSYTRLEIRGKKGEPIISENSKFWLNIEPTETGKLIPVDDYAKLIKEDGDYTLELLTTTPFGTETLGSIPITVDRTLHVRGFIGSAGE